MSHDPDFSESFYRRHAQRYAEVSHNFIQSVYSDVSHPGLQGDTDLMDRLQELVPQGCRGLDAGCGAGARDVFFYWQRGYDIYGVDAVDENIVEARRLHPEIASRVSVTDLREPLSYPDASFDFVLCNAVIQHIESATALGTTLPGFARVLRAGGVVLGILEGRDLRVIPTEGVKLGGVMYFKDPKPMDHCVFFARKDG